MLFLPGCLALLLVGYCLAFWSGKINHTNVLKADQMNAVIKETFDSENAETSEIVQKKVSFQNDSSSSAFLRVSYGETWETTEDDEKLLLNKP